MSTLLPGFFTLFSIACQSAEQQKDDAGGSAKDGGDAVDAGFDAADLEDAGGGFCDDDTYQPWAGGHSYYAQWENGPSANQNFFPIAVWLQAPHNAQAYKDIGINTFIGLWQGPTEDQLSAMSDNDMPVMCSQNSVGLSSANNDMIVAWTQQDEPDNAQSDGQGGYDPCVPTADIVARYNTMKSADPTRPVYLNLGQGVANDEWVGRGVCSGQDEDYPQYIQGADIVSFDIYPAVATRPNVAGNLWLVPLGVERLRAWANDEKPVWNWIETTHISNPNVRPTPHQVRAEVWMSLIHGAMGFGYFAHEFEPAFIEAGLLSHADITAAVADLNAQVMALAPVLNTQTIANGVTTTSSNTDVPVATMLKRHNGNSYLFAVAMRNATTEATFALTCVPNDATVEVIDESRQLTLSGTTLSDHFEGYQVHLYKILH